MNSDPNRPRKPQNLVFALIAATVVGGWFALWKFGIFKSLGPIPTAALIVSEVLMLAVLWYVLRRKT